MPDGKFSADRKWWWDGRQWMASTSDDGRWHWDGASWQPVAVPTSGPADAPGANSRPGLLRQIPGFRTMAPWKMVVAGVGYGAAAFWVLAALTSAKTGMAVFGLGVVALAVVGANGWGMRSRIPGIRSSKRIITAGTWAGLFVALFSVSAWASPATSQQQSTPTETSRPRVASTATPKYVAESTPVPASKPTATPTPSPSPTATPTAVPTTVPTAVPTALPVAAPPAAVPAPPAPPADPYAAATKAGASAVCADGTWSFSKNRSGTCSSHGGVHWWTGNLGPAGPGAH